MSVKIVDCEQGADEWFAARAGIITMSRAQCLMVKGRSESGLGEDAIGYIDELIGERLTGGNSMSFGGNWHTRRGKEMEPQAVAEYEALSGNKVAHCGIMLNHGVGYSPDGMVGDNGLVEVKSKLPKIMVKVLCGNEVPKEHIAQCQGGLWVSEREWLDFIAYWPGMPLFVKRIYRDEKYIKELAGRCELLYSVLAEREKVAKSNGYTGDQPW